MKGIIESSVYLIVFAYICLISIDFIRLNSEMMNISTTGQFVENYVEVNCGGMNAEETDVVLLRLQSELEKKGYRLEFGEEQVVRENTYMDYSLSFLVSSKLLKVSSTHSYHGLVRFAS